MTSNQEHPDQAITSNPDCPSLYSAHGGSCNPGYTPFPPSYAFWELYDPSSQSDQPALNRTSNECDFSTRAAQTDDEDLRSYLLAWLRNEKSNESCQDLSHRMPSSLYQATPETIIQNMNPLDHGNFALSESAATLDDKVLDISQSPSSVPGSGEASVHGRKSERRSGGKNKGSPSAAHCDLYSLAKFRVLDEVTKYPATEAETVASSLEELKTKAGRAEVSGKTLWYYQKWAAKQANIKDEEIELCSWCFKAYGVLLPAREMDGVLNACRCEKVPYERRLENNQRDSKERLDIGYKMWYPLHLPVDLA